MGIRVWLVLLRFTTRGKRSKSLLSLRLPGLDNRVTRMVGWLLCPCFKTGRLRSFRQCWLWCRPAHLTRATSSSSGLTSFRSSSPNSTEHRHLQATVSFSTTSSVETSPAEYPNDRHCSRRLTNHWVHGNGPPSNIEHGPFLSGGGKGTLTVSRGSRGTLR